MSELLGVSIVIPNYNYGHFIGAAIESALAQERPKIDVIVVDDGSTDNSREVIESFGNQIRAVYQTNQGHVAACTNGWRRARYDIVIFLDSDDMLTPDATSSVVCAWRPGISKIQWCLSVVDPSGRHVGHVFPKYPSPLEPETVRRGLLRVGNYPCARTSGNAYAREFLEAFGTVGGGISWMDGRLNPAAPLYGDVITLHRPLSLYRVHTANAYAYSRLSTEQLKRELEFARQNRDYLARCCARVGIAFDAKRALQRDLWYRQQQLVLAKLTAESRTPVWPLLRDMLSATLSSTEPLWQRLAIAAWATLVAATPPGWSRFLIGLRCEPMRRPQWLQSIAEHIGQRRRTRSTVRSPG
jgi:glycosyltransferase involved in cell wall biosynthesis